MKKTVDRAEALKLLAKCRRQFCTDEQIAELLEYPLAEVKDLDQEVQTELGELLAGVSNGFLSETYKILVGEEVEVVGSSRELFPCPCCQYKTLFEKYDIEKGTGYDICDYCNWEDDGTSDLDRRSSVNRGSLREYRTKIMENANFYYREKWHKES
jgi:hypothetical protein